MNSIELERLRTALLQTLREAAPYEVPLATLVTAAKISGAREADAKLIGAELVYLADLNLVTSPAKVVSPENSEWRITAHGRDYLASHGI